IIHKSLEGGGRVAQPEEHDSGFKESFVHDKHGLPLVSLFYSDIVIARSYIHLCKDRGSFEFINKGKGVRILHHVFVQILVILARAEGAIFLSYKEEGGSLGRFRRTDFSFSKVFFNELFCGLSF
ncbi:hypothetical protein M404DRAFT_150392, partial [Pisolithus tinctorius Marx 270]